MKTKEIRFPKIKLWLLIRGFTKKAFKVLVVNGADTIAEEIFKDLGDKYEQLHGVRPPAEMKQAMKESRVEFVEFIASQKASVILGEAKEYFIRG